MPVRNVGGGCYQWGKSGKKYCGKGARAKAERQARAIYSSGYTGKSKDMEKGIGEGIYGKDLRPEHLNRMFPRDKETIRPIDKAAVDYVNTGQYSDKPFTETTYDVYNYNSPDPKRDLNKNKGMKKMDKNAAVYDRYEHHSLDPTIDELRVRFGDKLKPEENSEIEKLLRERDHYMGDVRKALEKVDAIIEKSNRWHEAEMERKLLAVDAFIAKANTGLLIDDFDLVRSGVDRPMLALFQKNGRPDKEWWNKCVDRADSFADDPAAYCGRLWVGPNTEKSMDLKKDHTADDTLDIIHTVVDVLDKERHTPGEVMEDYGHDGAMPMGSEFRNNNTEEENTDSIFVDNKDSEDLEKAGKPWTDKRFEEQKRAFGKEE